MKKIKTFDNISPLTLSEGFVGVEPRQTNLNPFKSVLFEEKYIYQYYADLEDRSIINQGFFSAYASRDGFRKVCCQDDSCAFLDNRTGKFIGSKCAHAWSSESGFRTIKLNEDSDYQIIDNDTDLLVSKETRAALIELRSKFETTAERDQTAQKYTISENSFGNVKILDETGKPITFKFLTSEQEIEDYYKRVEVRNSLKPKRAFEIIEKIKENPSLVSKLSPEQVLAYDLIKEREGIDVIGDAVNEALHNFATYLLYLKHIDRDYHKKIDVPQVVLEAASRINMSLSFSRKNGNKKMILHDLVKAAKEDESYQTSMIINSSFPKTDKAEFNNTEPEVAEDSSVSDTKQNEDNSVKDTCPAVETNTCDICCGDLSKELDSESAEAESDNSGMGF